MTMLSIVRKFAKPVGAFLIISLVSQLAWPTLSFALTNPIQGEHQGFSPAGGGDMVDLFTGDFSYDIPLFDLPGPSGGYPINMSYNSGFSMDDESSWVGSGWSLTPGAVNRSVRGLPDDFRNDEISREYDIKTNITFGGGPKVGAELFGALDVGLGLSAYYNSYTGFGQTVSNTLSLDLISIGGVGLGYNHSMDVDSQKGMTFAPSLGLSAKSNGFMVGAGYGIAYNSRAGFLGHGYSVMGGAEVRGKMRTASYSSFNPTFQPKSPSAPIPMKGLNLDTDFTYGGEIWGVYGSMGGEGYFATQSPDLPDGKMRLPGYGYMYLDKAKADKITPLMRAKINQINSLGLVHIDIDKLGIDERVILDQSREKESQVYEDMPNLATPNLTADVFSVSGNGIGGTFRAFRSDVGIMHDPYVLSHIDGYGLGAKVGAGTYAKIGGNASVTNSDSYQRRWTNRNDLLETFGFKSSQESNPLYEPYYFKMGGEHTTNATNELSYIGGEEPVRVKLKRDKHEPKALNTLVTSSGGEFTPQAFNPTKLRESRNTLIQQFTNDQILENGNEVLGELEVDYFNGNSNVPSEYIRSRPKHHLAGFVTTNTDGERFVYGLPAYTNQKVECTYSANGGGDFKDGSNSTLIDVETDGSKPDYKGSENKDSYELFDRKTTGEHAQSYLLTQILGANYEDVDGVPGPSEGDKGYWVKFKYAKRENYNWRFPFSGANFVEGDGTTDRDDVGVYSYGEREQWYLKTAETKTHIADFTISQRKDNAGAFAELGVNASIGGNDIGASSYKLDRIDLYTKKEYVKADSEPIKSVHFRYNYELCPNVPNNDQSADNTWDEDGDGVIDNNNSGKGKLTLKKVWFTYGDNTRGELNPYQFDYSSSNPPYKSTNTDRWGMYQMYSDNLERQYYPFTKQGNFERNYSLAKEESRAQKNADASSWQLVRVHEPSGSTTEVTYEADDYAYVQDEVACNMFQLAGMGNEDNEYLTHGTRRVYFHLSQELSAKEELLPYFSSFTDQLLFRTKMYVQSPNQDDYQTYINVWANIDKSIPDNGWYGLSGDGKKGWVAVKAVSSSHPFALAGWQFLQMERSDITNTNLFVGTVDDESSTAKKIAHITTFAAGGVLAEIKRSAQGFDNLAKQKKWSTRIDLDHSWVRLQDPERDKIGGGIRVKKIAFYDNWDEVNGGFLPFSSQSTTTKGIVYDYSKEEVVNGETMKISSGVAAYEPAVGAEENPVRKAKPYIHDIPWASDQHLNFEQPINENYYPAAVVGYSHVSVRSLATDNVLNAATGDAWKNVPTTGQTEFEFYTAKDFPVITGETSNADDSYDKTKSIPFKGTNTYARVWGSQGYMAKLNDMHGKTKKVSYFGQSPSGELLPDAYASTTYNYHSKKRYRANGNSYSVLDNKLPTLTSLDAVNGELQKETKTIGQDYEFFTDMREVQSKTTQTTIGFSVDVIPFLFGVPLPIPTDFPKKNTNNTQVRTAVTNKIIYTSGVISSIESYDQGKRSVVSTELYDSETGEPVLTKTTNNFDAPVYSYEVPGHKAYKGMGQAARNQGMSFTAQIGNSNGFSLDANHYVALPTENGILGKLHEGDQFIIDRGGALALAELVRFHDDHLVISMDEDFTGGNVTFVLHRSGFTNQVGESLQTVVGLEDPTKGGVEGACTNTIDILQFDPNTEKLAIDETKVHHVIEFLDEFVPLWWGILGDPYFDDAQYADPEVEDIYHTLADGTLYKRFQFLDIAEPYLDPDSRYVNPFYAPYRKLEDSYNNGYFNSLETGWPKNFTKKFYGTVLRGGNAPQEAQRIAEFSEDYWVGISTFVDGGVVRVHDMNRIENEHNVEFSHFSYARPPHQAPRVIARLGDLDRLDNNLFTWYDYQFAYHLDEILYEAYGEGENFTFGSNPNRYEFSGFEWKGEYVDLSDYVDVPVTNELIYTDWEVRQPLLVLEATIDGVTEKFITGIRPPLKTVPKLVVTTRDVNSVSQKVDNLVTTSANNSTQFNAYLGKESFAVNQSRTQTTDPNLSTDGVMNDVALFDWKNPFFTNCNPEWIKTSEVEKRNSNELVTQTTTLSDIPASTLFGYNDRLTLAMAGNAAQQELVSEGFEEYSVDQNIVAYDDLGGGQLDFFTSKDMDVYPAMTEKHNYDVISGNGNLLIIDKPFDQAWANEIGLLNKHIEFKGHRISDATDEIVRGKFTVSNYEAYPGDDTRSIVELGPDFPWHPESLLWMGEMIIEELVDAQPKTFGVINNRTDPYNSTLLSIDETMSHSGSKSLKVLRNVSGYSVDIVQRRFHPRPHQRYVLNGWLSLGDEFSKWVTTYLDGTSYDLNEEWRRRIATSPSVEVRFFDADNNDIGGQKSQLKGTLVDSWQQFEVDFVTPEHCQYVLLKLSQGVLSYTYPGGSGGGHTFKSSYFDDIRIHPYNAEMQSYVYDDQFRVTAILDRNNYARYIHYNSEGKPFFVEQETEKGVFTITETRSHSAKLNEGQ